MATKTLQYGKGYTGKLGNKAWVARILGLDSAMNFRRDFLEAGHVEKESKGPRSLITLRFRVEPGLYEMSECGERRFFVCYAKGETEEFFTVTSERARKIAKMLDAGVDFETARVATK